MYAVIDGPASRFTPANGLRARRGTDLRRHRSTRHLLNRGIDEFEARAYFFHPNLRARVCVPLCPNRHVHRKRAVGSIWVTPAKIALDSGRPLNRPTRALIKSNLFR